MTEILLSEGPINRALEIGTGSGYQTTILSQLVSEVVSVERIEPLFKQAKERFRKLRLNNITASLSDGSLGFEDYAPIMALSQLRLRIRYLINCLFN